MRIIFNKDEKITNALRNAVKKKDGYCPCRVDKVEDKYCMCKEFRDTITVLGVDFSESAESP